MVRIRQTKDWRSAMGLDAQLFPEDFDSVGDPDSEVWFIGTDKQQVACYASYRLLEDRTIAYLTRAGVSKAYQGKGLQKRLIRVRCKHAKSRGAKKIITYVHKNNSASINSLISCGFKAYQPAQAWAGRDNFLYFWRPL